MNNLLTYLEWSEQDQRVERTITEAAVTRDDIFVRKLVNATVFRNALFEHTANECEDGKRHHIYAKPYNEFDDTVYGQAIRNALHEYVTVSPYMEVEYLLWNGYRFNPCALPLLEPASPLEFAQLLLDHYIVSEQKTYETVYTVYDMDRSKIVVFLKGVNL
ncbi:hypothetical protein [Paenibacillus sp. LHD-38]|uniref:hypothetical protein n=1 Tax=Paenibacillus sp. LHD-38 TaxID=3072143 RepID=UPI00280C5111|nr:hypothetical protein [Paenibacillus sp. LHD-38]MDQ8736302.1 hypothetical protein [Paenibacillus sp. LHD-38]